METRPTFMQRLVAEGIGTAILVWLGPGAATVVGLLGGVKSFADVLTIALAFAFAIAAAIYTVGKISGCHINPAVTIALAARGRFPWNEVLPYIVAQLVGGVVGALLIVAAIGTQGASQFNLGGTYLNTAAGLTVFNGLIAEAVGTFILMITIMGVAVDERAPVGWAGLIIGLIVGGIIITLGPMTGSSLNPARTFGPYVGNLLFGGQAPWDQFLVLYVLGPIIGAVAAAFVYDYVAGLLVRPAPVPPAAPTELPAAR